MRIFHFISISIVIVIGMNMGILSYFTSNCPVINEVVGIYKGEKKHI